VIDSRDIYVLAGASASDSITPSLRELAAQLHVDHTLVHRSLKRAAEAGLYSTSLQRVNRAGFEELVIHAARFIAPAPLGPLVAGVPAAWAAEPVASHIRQSGDDPPPVWPLAGGLVRGQSFEPLHPSAPAAAAEQPRIGELLAIIDSLRVEDLRVRKVATRLFHDQLAAVGAKVVS
jgi:hypothetical protein